LVVEAFDCGVLAALFFGVTFVLDEAAEPFEDVTVFFSEIEILPFFSTTTT
jgi:hypothetical protein